MRERVKTRNTKYGKKLNKRLMPNWKREIQDTIEIEKRKIAKVRDREREKKRTI